MKLLYFILAIATLQLFAQCDQPEKGMESTCEVDDRLMANYNNCLLILSKTRQGELIDFEDRFRAIECLEAITSYQSNIIKHSDSPYLLYKLDPNDPDKDLFESDLKVWKSWLEMNKCNISMNDVEAAFSLRSQDLGVDLKWPSHN